MFIGYNSCQGGKWNVIQVFNWSVCQPSWFILQNKCMVDARWPLESRAESDFGHLSSRLVCLFTPGKICHELWVGSGHRQHTSPSGTDNPRLPTLFWWAMSSSYAKNNALSLRIGKLWGFIRGCSALGNVTIKIEGARPRQEIRSLPSTSSHLNVDVHAWRIPRRGYAALIERGRGVATKSFVQKGTKKQPGDGRCQEALSWTPSWRKVNLR